MQQGFQKNPKLLINESNFTVKTQKRQMCRKNGEEDEHPREPVSCVKITKLYLEYSSQAVAESLLDAPGLPATPHAERKRVE